MTDAQATAGARRRLAIEAMGRELDGSSPTSAARRLEDLMKAPRPMVVSADIDGLVSAVMLASVAPDWDIVGFISGSAKWLLHPSVQAQMPSDLVAVDLFSLNHDSISNHVVRWGDRRPQLKSLATSWQVWDQLVDASASQRVLACPSIWARTQAGYEDYGRPTSAKYKYPLGTAQILLAMLEVAGRPPKFYDRHYLPWLVANCDGGVRTYTEYAFNARVWWPVMAGAVGPASLTEQIFRMVDYMRPHDFQDTVTALDRERQASGEPKWLNDQWNLAGSSVSTLQRTLRWLCDLTGWRDPVRGGIDRLPTWTYLPVVGSGIVNLAGPDRVSAATERAAVASVTAATNAMNANFYHGGYAGTRFNWAGGW